MGTQGKYAVLVLDTATGNYKVTQARLTRYQASAAAQRLREDMNDPFDGIGQDRVIIAPRGR